MSEDCHKQEKGLAQFLLRLVLFCDLNKLNEEWICSTQ